MNILITAGVVAFAVFLVWQVARKQDEKRRAPGGALAAEYRTDLALDECIDALRAQTEADIFQYECARQPDGCFLLHFTLHRPTCQPLDTVYLLRLDAGRQTVVTLTFVREAFGSPEPVFGPALLDGFICAKFAAARSL